jgi:GT2 family glycosyltransferase
MSPPKIAIIILNWNGKEDTIECLESLKQITYPNYEILIVDNHSTDGSVECFRERYPDVEILENEKNLGYAEGNNVGIRKVMERGVDYVLLLNDDTVVDKEFLGELVKAAQSDLKVGFAGPKVYYYDYKGRKDVIHSAGAKIDIRRGYAPPIGANELDIGQYDILNKADYLEGACMLIKRNVIRDIGLLNTKYFMYWEETDWCVRAREKGYNVIYVPKARIWHKISASSNLKYIYYINRNMLWFLKKHASMREYIYFIIYFFGYKMWSSYGIFYYLNNRKNLILYCRGIRDGFLK